MKKELVYTSGQFLLFLVVTQMLSLFRRRIFIIIKEKKPGHCSESSKYRMRLFQLYPFRVLQDLEFYAVDRKKGIVFPCNFSTQGPYFLQVFLLRLATRLSSSMNRVIILPFGIE